MRRVNVLTPGIWLSGAGQGSWMRGYAYYTLLSRSGRRHFSESWAPSTSAAGIRGALRTDQERRPYVAPRG